MIALLSYFMSITRDSGETAWCLTEDRPEWLQDAIREVHGSDLPNDWIYSACRDACSAIDDGALTDDDSIHEWADSQVDVYTRDLYRWAGDMCTTDLFSDAESEASDFGTPGNDNDPTKRIGVVQYCAYSTIARTLMTAHGDATTEDDDS